MERSIKITFPVKKKGTNDTYRTMSEFHQLGDALCFVLHETTRGLQRKNHFVTEGCIIEDLITGETFKCFQVTLTVVPPHYAGRPV